MYIYDVIYEHLLHLRCEPSLIKSFILGLIPQQKKAFVKFNLAQIIVNKIKLFSMSNIFFSLIFLINFAFIRYFHAFF